MTTSDFSLLYQVLNSTFHLEQTVRTQAEETLKALKKQPGFIVALLQLIASPQIEISIKQAGSIFFKNQLLKKWDPSHKHALPNEEKIFIKENFLTLFTQSPESIQKQLLPSLRIMLKYDYPTAWPNLLESVIQNLHSKDIFVLQSTLLVCQQLANWKSCEGEADVEITSKLFPLIQSIGFNLVQHSSVESFLMLKTILKSFKYCVQYDLPQVLQTHQNLAKWCELFIAVIQKPNTMNINDPDHIFWNMKKWAFHCLNKLNGRYGNPNAYSIRKGNYKAFSKMYLHDFFPAIFTTYMKTIQDYVNGEFMTGKIRQLVAEFLDDGIRNKNSWKLILANLEFIVARFIFPQLCFTNEDQELWEEDPYEYIHKKYDPIEDFGSPVCSVMNLLIDLVKERKKTTFFPILSFITNILTANLQSEKKNPREKDGALCMIGTIASVLLNKKSEVKEQMEEFLMVHVLPEFNSEQAFLRSRACWVLEQFSDTSFSTVGNVISLLNGVMKCIKDSELPVKIRGAIALGPMIDFEEIRDYLKGNIAFVMQEIMFLANESDLEPLALVMEKIVSNFPDELTPFASQLVSQMIQMYMRLVNDISQQADDGNDDIGTDKLFTATGILKTITTLIYSLKTGPDTLKEITGLLIPVFVHALNGSMVDVYDEIFELMETITCGTASISPDMWNLVFPLICKTFKDISSDFIDEIFPVLYNFVIYGSQFLLENDIFLQNYMDLIQFIMTSEDCGINDCILGCRLTEAILLSARGSEKLNSYIPLILSWVVPKANQAKTNCFTVHLFNVMVNCFLYNFDATYKLLHGQSLLYVFIEKLISDLSKFSRVYDKKLLSLLFIKFLCFFDGTLEHFYPKIFNALVQVLSSLPKAIEEREELEKLATSDSDLESDFDDDEEIEDEEDEDFSAAQTAGEIQSLANQAAAVNQSQSADDDDDDLEDEDSSWLDTLEEDIYNPTPLDNVDVYPLFKDLYASLQAKNSFAHSSIQNTISNEEKSYLQQLLIVIENSSSIVKSFGIN